MQLNLINRSATKESPSGSSVSVESVNGSAISKGPNITKNKEKVAVVLKYYMEGGNIRNFSILP